MANEPITREEIMLNAVATGEQANIKPITREEMFLAKLGGQEVTVPTPITRKEQFLQKAIENAGSGGNTGGGDTGDIGAGKYLEAQYAEVVLPNVKSIKPYAFYQDKVLTSVFVPSVVTICAHAFDNCINLVSLSLPNSLKSIEEYAFSSCRRLVLPTLPSGLENLARNAFYDCKSQTSITFEGTPINIDSGAFNGCFYITTINVPWAEGEVANAPWGATNATINYNYTGE